MALEKGKLGQLMGLLSEREWDLLATYLDSPWFNRSTTVVRLFEVYRTARIASDFPADEALFELVAPDQPFDAVKLKNIRAAFQRKFDDFLAELAFSEDAPLRQGLLLQQLNAFGESQYFPRYYHKSLEILSEAPIEEDQRYLRRAQIASEWEHFQFRQTDRSELEAKDGAYGHLWLFFQIQTLKQLVRRANREAISGSETEISVADQVLQIIHQQSQMSHPPILQIYLQLLAVFRNPQDRNAYTQLHELLQAQGPNLAHADALDAYTGALNHCIRRVNAGERDFENEMLALYQEMHDADLLLYKGKMPAPQLKNIVALGLRCGAFEWVQAIIDRYGDLLENDPHGNASAFNQGLLHFYLRDFAASERCFNQVLANFDDIFYGLDARTILLRIYFETNNQLGAESMAESFRMYLKRNKYIPKAHKASYSTMLRLYRKLLKLPFWDRQKLESLHKEVMQSTLATGSKRWFALAIEGLQAREHQP
jgi:hypothetical protein